MSADDIIKKYGTHVYFAVDFGHKVHIDIVAQVKDNSAESLAIALEEISSKYLFPLMSWHSEKELAKNVLNWKLNFYTIGGNPEKKLTGQFDKFNPQKIDLTEWNKGLDNKNTEMIDAGYVPIYDVVKDPVKSAALKIAYDKYIKSKEIVFVN